MDNDFLLKTVISIFIFTFSVLFFPLVLGLLIGFLLIKKPVSLSIFIKEKSVKITLFISLVCIFLVLWQSAPSKYAIGIVSILTLIMGALLPFLYFKRSNFWLKGSEITTKNFFQIKAQNLGKYNISNENKAYIGYSMKNLKPIYLEKKDRTKHTIISGSTGSGKTTMLKSLYIDAMKNNYPVLLIDPKGNSETIKEFQALTNKYSPKPKNIKIFSLISPEKSLSYNPLKRGSAVQIKDRLMSSLEWSEQYYKNQANAWLGEMIQILKSLDMEISISTLHRLLIDRKASDEIELKIKKIEDKKKSLYLLNLLKKALKSNPEKLDNLVSQLSDLNNYETGKLLNIDNGAEDINLIDCLKNREIVYFQLNTMAYDLTARCIGKLILSDLKCLASEIHGGNLAVKPTFFPIFIDEFGSFCTSSFIEMLKMCRDVDFALHLFFQSLADLDVVSPEFKSQVQQNCINKIILRTDDPKEVEFWSSVAGTSEAHEQSFQYKKILGLSFKTGMGNSRGSRKMKIEHDVFKSLNIGQSVLIQKSPSKEDLLQLWNPS